MVPPYNQQTHCLQNSSLSVTSFRKVMHSTFAEKLSQFHPCQQQYKNDIHSTNRRNLTLTLNTPLTLTLVLIVTLNLASVLSLIKFYVSEDRVDILLQCIAVPLNNNILI